jgi:hypothetical protein
MRRMVAGSGRTPGVSAVCAALLCACAAAEAPPEPARYASWPEPLEHMPRGPAQTARVCERGGNDSVRGVFCGPQPVPIASLADLQAALGVGTDQLGGISGLAVGGHSTALSARSVSAINPRVIVVRLEVMPDSLLALAFTRGEQFAELVVRDLDDEELRFYVVGFRQACNDSPKGCTPGDLLTPAVEHDWRDVTLYAEQDLENTVLDCAPCHQPDGPGTRKLLRMHELHDPWTHWFWKSSAGGRALLADYFAAKGDEPLAGMTAEQIHNAHPGNLSMLVDFDDAPQPNLFDAPAIEAEVQASAAARGGAQPEDNRVPGESATWRATYERSLRGEAMTVPYHDVKVTDPEKLAAMTSAYQEYLRGERAPADLPDIRDVYPDDPALLAAMGFETEPGLSGEEVLVQACSLCHNERLDPSLSRARFRPDLSWLSRAQRNEAIARLRLPESDPRAMPPARLRSLSPEARARAIEALREGL